MECAWNIFNKLPMHAMDCINYSVMMNALCINGLNVECICLFKQCIQSNIRMNEILFSVALKACIHETAINEGLKIEHFLASNSAYCHLLRSLDIQNKLLCLYGKAQRIDLCETMFHKIKR